MRANTAIDALWTDPYEIYRDYLKPKEVIFQAPRTIVNWSDGTKTVVKCTDCICCEPTSPLLGTCYAERGDFDTRDWEIKSFEWMKNGLLNAWLKRICPDYLKTIKELETYVSNQWKENANGKKHPIFKCQV